MFSVPLRYRTYIPVLRTLQFCNVSFDEKMIPMPEILKTVVNISVADPDPLETDPDPACQFHMDPNPDFQFNTDPDPAV
jgi:hypothetical protein